MKRYLFVCAALLTVCVCSVFAQTVPTTQTALSAFGKSGKSLGDCPLKHTAVKAEISGFLARVNVTQEFANNYDEPIEAVYIFPLPAGAAVDEMTMTIGTRTIRGKILKREEAKQVYETARDNGQAAALLDQERPNVFTQSVANIQPDENIVVQLSYVETLKYEDGSYEFVFPTVVAPRYNPSSVQDAANITPTLAPANTRAGHDISIEINLDAGVPIENVTSKSHEVETVNLSDKRANIKLKNEGEIPNRDFILRYDVSGKRIENALLTHRDARGGYFTLILQPPDRMTTEDITPKEIVFVLDTSGSMSGFPIEKAKEAMRLALDGMNPLDTFNLITFAGDTAILFPEPVPATRENLRKAQEFLESRQGAGGTEMMTAIKAALAPSDANDHVRVVCFMTDGEVGNDNEIIAEVQKHPNARVFSFGIGSSVNRYLLEKIAQEGRGEAEFVQLTDDGSAAAKRFHERVSSPLLTDIELDWNGLPIADVYPRKIQDLFSAKPVIVYGRFTKAATGTIRLKGKVSGQEFVREIPIIFPDRELSHDTLATLWARTKIDDLTNQSYKYSQASDESELQMKPQIENQIRQLGLEFRLLTQFTSFVAVEEKIVNQNGKPRRVEVPVETPFGVKRDMIAGDDNDVVSVSGATTTVNVTSSAVASLSVNGSRVSKRKVSKLALRKSGSGSGRGNGRGSGVGYGSAGGIGSGSGNGSNAPPPPLLKPSVVSAGVVNGKASKLIQPSYPPAAKAVRATGAVNVQVITDEQGNVVSATAISGHPLLRAAAVQAALASKFTPTQMSGQPVKTTGVIVYNFVKDESPTIVVKETTPAPNLTDDEIKQQKLDAKLDAKLADLLDKFKAGQTDLSQYAFVQNGRAEVFIELVSNTPVALAELKTLGFEIAQNQKQGVYLTGTVPLDKIATIALLESVKLVALRTK